MRIFLQDEADNQQFGGELAPGGPPPAVPALRLLPIVQMQQSLRKLVPLVGDQSRWDEIAAVVSTGSFVTLEFKRVFVSTGDTNRATLST